MVHLLLHLVMKRNQRILFIALRHSVVKTGACKDLSKKVFPVKVREASDKFLQNEISKIRRCAGLSFELYCIFGKPMQNQVFSPDSGL